MSRAGEGRRWYSLDGLRSVVNLTDDAGAEVASYHLDAWGNFRFPAELSDSRNRFAFTGYEWDPELGLFNAKARYFDPQIGRFISQDSFLGEVSEPPSLHRYFYANANPTRFIDLSGHAGAEANSTNTTAVSIATALVRIQEFRQNLGMFTAGFANAFGSNALLGAGRVEGSARAYRVGQAAGDIASMIHGAQEMAQGGGMVAGGTALAGAGTVEAVATSPTVVGAAPGAAAAGAGTGAAVAGGFFILHGGSRVALGASHLMENLKDDSGSKAKVRTESASGDAATPTAGQKPESSATPTLEPAVPEPGELQTRAKEIQAAHRNSIARDHSVTAVGRVKRSDGSVERWVASSEDVPRSEQRQALREGERVVRGKGDAERTLVDEYNARVKAGEKITLEEIGTSSPICSECETAMHQAGVKPEAGNPLKGAPSARRQRELRQGQEPKPDKQLRLPFEEQKSQQ
jgi:RHS repeat-associated protein